MRFAQRPPPGGRFFCRLAIEIPSGGSSTSTDVVSLRQVGCPPLFLRFIQSQTRGAISHANDPGHHSADQAQRGSRGAQEDQGRSEQPVNGLVPGSRFPVPGSWFLALGWRLPRGS